MMCAGLSAVMVVASGSVLSAAQATRKAGSSSCTVGIDAEIPAIAAALLLSVRSRRDFAFAAMYSRRLAGSSCESGT